MQQDRRAAGTHRSTRLTLLIGLEEPCSLKFEHWGFEPHPIDSPAQAREELARLTGPAVVLVDFRHGGPELCQYIRATAASYPTYVYVLLAARPEDRVQGLEAGADDVLTLPLDLAELRARMLVGRRILAHELALRAERDTFHAQSMRDGLTGLYNRTAIQEALERDLSRASRDGSAVGVVMADIDHFKQLNDQHGHLVGDEVLREVALRMRRTVRRYDSVGRYGGEEFLLIFPGCDRSLTLMLAERIRNVVGATPVSLSEPPWEVPVTISLGISSDEHGARSDPLGHIRAADQGLYAAKEAGRNRVAWTREHS